MPALPQYIIEPIWEQFRALLPERKADHPLSCHKPRIPDRAIFEKLLQILVFGCACLRIADGSCSATTLRRRHDEWIEAGAMDALEGVVLKASDREGWITKAPCGGQKAGRSPVDRGKRGLKRSAALDSNGIPLGVVTAPTNRHDSPLLGETLDAVVQTLGGLPDRASIHLDRGYDSKVTKELLENRGLIGVISEKGKPAPLRAGMRWVVERPNSWHNAHKKLV